MGDEMMWLRREIAVGLGRLATLRLAGFPAADDIQYVVRSWYETLLTEPIQWDESLDQARIRHSFMMLARVCDRWPAPKTFLDHLPPRPARPSLPEPPMPKEKVAQNVGKIQELLRWFKGNRESQNG
ncbi:hypothetical protein SIID45300_01761 [Candidatus Magnetaquicoccaceae bacterium FCR-1]|uniref:Uncharacterized protein n=1 Tax=Candidatus Magnetaquiglobus chichijimensis TaxID=3141448 RepID=A0ABQ0C974_9PROT